MPTTRQMEALVIEASGPPAQSLAYRSQPVPEPGPGEVLVEVHAAAVNPLDLANVAGLLGTPLPMIPGGDYAGVVVSEAAGSKAVQSIIEPFRALFVSIFFVAMGMTIDPALIYARWQTIAILGVGFIALRLVGWTAFGRLAGLALPTAALAGIARAAAARRVTLTNR